MSYTITLTNGTTFAVIPDGTLNTKSSLTLIGQNYVGGYGEFQDDNFIRLLETGANNIPPSAPLVGQLWYNSVTQQINVYTGQGFKPVNGAAASTTAPTVCSTGDLWFNTTTQTLNVYNGSSWINIGPNNSGSGITTANIVDTNYVSHLVDEITISSNVVSIISQDGSFTPLDPLPGYSRINPGINIPTVINGQQPFFTGTSTNSQLLNGLDSDAFMSTLYNTATVGQISIYNSNGLIVANTFQASTSGNSASLQNIVNGGNINLVANVGGIANTVVTIDGQNGSVVIFGNLQIDGYIIADLVIDGNLIVRGIEADTITANVGNIITVNANTVNANTINANTINATSLTLTDPLATQYGGTGLSAPGTAGNVLASDGTNWYSTAAIGPGGIIRGLGFGGEIWIDVTSSRAFNVVYTNTHPYPIMVSATTTDGPDSNIRSFVDGIQITYWIWQWNGNGSEGGAIFIVPPGATYELSSSQGVTNWAELY